MMALSLALCLAGVPGYQAIADDGWKITATPYMWLQGANGDIKVHGIKAKLDDSFIDMVKSSDTIIGGFVHLEAWREQWGLYAEGNYSYTSTKGEIIGRISTKVQTGLTILEAGGFYKLAGGPLPSNGAPQNWQIEALAGARYVAFNVKADVGRLSLDRTIDWVDPLVGVSGHVDFAENWTLIGHGDVGGFGIGSEFSTNLYGLVGYRAEMFGTKVLSAFGYRGLYINRRDASKSNGANLWLHGPVLGMTFSF